MILSKEEVADKLKQLQANPSIGGKGKIMAGSDTPGKKRLIKASSDTPTIEFVKTHNDTVYEFKQDEETILTSSDSDLPLILGKFNSIEDEMPPNMKDWLENYGEEIEWYQSTGKDIELPGFADAAPKSVLKTIGPLLNCKWGQSSPYNSAISFNGNTCMTGCGGTAIAMMWYYWACQSHNGKYYHRGCVKLPSYITRTNKYKVEGLPNITTFDFKNMTSGKPTKSAQIKAVGDLMKYCGCSIKSDFGPGATSSYLSDIRNSLADCFKMGDVITIAANSDSKFELKIINELENERCVLFFGTGSNGGHFFICDGYNSSTNLFHFNWGWGGNYNGWFALSALNPSHYAFNTNKKALIHIQPQYVLGDINDDGIVTVSDVMALQNQILTGHTSYKSDVNNDGNADVADLMTIVGAVTGKNDI